MRFYYIILCLQFTIILAEKPQKIADTPNKIEQSKKTLGEQISHQTILASLKGAALLCILWGTYTTIKSTRNTFKIINPLLSINEVSEEELEILREKRQKWRDHIYDTVMPHSAVLLAALTYCGKRLLFGIFKNLKRRSELKKELEALKSQPK